MGRRARPVPLTPAENVFRLADWIDRNLIVEDKSGPEWLCHCPLCGRPKLAIHVGRKAFHCLSASCAFASWRPCMLVAAVLGCSVDTALEVIAAFGIGREIGPVGALGSDEEPARRAADLPVGALPPVHWGLLPEQLAYVRHRRIPAQHAEMFGLSTIVSDGTGSKADRMLSGRVFFPVWAPTGRMVFWAARSIRGDTDAKVINMPRSCRIHDHGEWCTCYHTEWGLPPTAKAALGGEVVLGLHLVQRDQPVIVVEGPVDAAVCGPGFVATLGAHMTPAQALQIASTGASEAIVLYDGDEGGYAGTPKAVATLGAYMPTRSAICPPGMDPGKLGRAMALAIALAIGPVDTLPPLGTTIVRSEKPRSQPPFLAPLQKT